VFADALLQFIGRDDPEGLAEVQKINGVLFAMTHPWLDSH
jgi:hypothetical protein